jgi:hypothetical protein
MKVVIGKYPETPQIHIDSWDTWNMDHTLADIILPMLIQLKETKHGAPFVDDEDVPEELRSTSAPPKENEWDTDANHFKRWDWVMDEMIYAFDSKVNKDNLIMRFDIDRERDEMNAEQARISNGFCLFGKYYESLWD